MRHRRVCIATSLAALAVASTLAVAPDAAAATFEANVLNHGAKANDTYDDSAAIQKANDAVRNAGGGRVYFPEGTYLAKDIKQDSGVEFYGRDRATTIIKHAAPNLAPKSQRPLIQGRTFPEPNQTIIKAWTTANSPVIRVNEASRFAVGSVVAVKAAGGAAPDQATALRGLLLAGSTSMMVDSIKDFATITDHRVLWVDGELIQYTSYNPSVRQFTGLYRGRYGTRAVAHQAGAPVAQAQRLYAEVTAVSGTNITLNRPVPFTIAGAQVAVGSQRMTIRGLTLDGAQPDGFDGGEPWPLWYSLARYVTVVNSTIRNADNGGIQLDQGTRDSVIDSNVFWHNGDEAAPGSGHVWMFRGAIRNTVTNNDMAGPMKNGVAIDDRTQAATEFDAPSNDNVITHNVINLWEDRNIGPDVGPTGISSYGSFQDGSDPSINNFIANNTIVFTNPAYPDRRGGTGVFVGWYTQGTDPLNSTAHSVRFNAFSGLQVGIGTNGDGNLFADNTFDETVNLPCEPLNQKNTFLRNGPLCPDTL